MSEKKSRLKAKEKEKLASKGKTTKKQPVKQETHKEAAVVGAKK
jgi:hypothetical protein